MNNREYDAVVIGLGPAGSTAVRLLSEKGLRVLGVDRVQFPRWKPCGGGLSARAVPLLPSGWESVPHVVTTGVEVTMGLGLSQKVDMEAPIAYQFHRDQLDWFLFEEGGRHGADIRCGISVEDLSYSAGGVFSLSVNGESLRTRALFAADGVTSQVKRSLFGSPREEKRIPAGARAENREKKGWPSSELLGNACFPDDDRYVLIDIGNVPGGYGWSFPKAGDRKALGVAGFLGPLSSPVRVLRDFLKSLRGMGQDPEDGSVSTWIIPSWQYVREHGEIPGLFLLGDAGGLVDPFLGEGIYYAILSGTRATEAFLQTDTPEEASDLYADWVKKELFKDFAQASRLAAVIYRFPGVYFKLVKKYPQLLSLFAQIMMGMHDYRSFSRSAGVKLLRIPFRKILPTQRPGRRFF